MKGTRGTVFISTKATTGNSGAVRRSASAYKDSGQTSATVAICANNVLTDCNTTTLRSTELRICSSNNWSRADWREARQTEQSEARKVRLPRGGSRINSRVFVRNAQTSATVATYAYHRLTRRLTTTIGSTVRRFYYNGVWSRADWREVRQTERSEARRAIEPWGGSVVNNVEERLNASSNAERVYYWSTREKKSILIQ